jgi:hypothetical protein
LPETRVGREAEAAEYEVTGRGEMTEARAARLERLRSMEQTIEQEHRDHEGLDLGPSRPAGDRSR